MQGGQGPGLIAPLESIIAVCPGQMLVLPVELRGSMPTSAALQVRFGDVPVERGSLVWIGVVADEPAAAGGRAAPAPPAYALSWMGPVGQWSITPGSRATRPFSTGTWALVVQAPAALAADRPAHMVRIGEQSFPLVVLQSGRGGFADLSPLPTPVHFSTSWVQSLDRSPWLQRTLDAQLLSPLHRWRARLAQRLIAGAAGREAPATPSDRFVDPVLEAWAWQLEARWASALARLAETDLLLAGEVAWRLAAVADFGGGVAMPVWPQDGPQLSTLLSDMLNPLLSPREIALGARMWLDGQPAGVLWVLDDGGLSDAATGGLASTIGVVNLETEPAVAWAAHQRGPRTGEMTVVRPRSSARSLAAAPARTGAARPEMRGGAPAGGTVEARIGELSVTRSVVSVAIPVAPPGLRLGPLAPDWSLAAWLAGGTALDEGGSAAAAAADAARLEEQWMTAAMLYRLEAGAPRTLEQGLGPTGRPDSGRQWMLYVECRRPAAAQPAAAAGDGSQPMPGVGQVVRPSPGGTAAQSRGQGGSAAAAALQFDEELRVWLGPTGSPRAVLRVTPSGIVYDDTALSDPSASAASMKASAARVPVRIEDDRWSFWLPIPERAIEDAGLLRLALERVDARGARTAWPRPMLPWQREPGRAALDLAAW